MTLYTTALWFYTVMASLVFGASVYEALVVHPAWGSPNARPGVRVTDATLEAVRGERYWSERRELVTRSPLLLTSAHPRRVH